MIHRDILFLASRAVLAGVWGYGLFRIWKYRHLPQANQVLAAALAMVLSDSAFLLDIAEKDVLVFFSAMAQVTMITAFAQMFKELNKKTIRHSPSVTPENITMLLGIGGAGLFGVFAQYLWMR